MADSVGAAASRPGDRGATCPAPCLKLAHLDARGRRRQRAWLTIAGQRGLNRTWLALHPWSALTAQHGGRERHPYHRACRSGRDGYRCFDGVRLAGCAPRQARPGNHGAVARALAVAGARDRPAAAAVAFRAVRWSVMFPARRRPSPGACFWAINIGYLANALLPFRAGELIRVMALSKDTGTPTGQGLVTILLERLFDLFTVAVLTLAVAPMIPASWARTWLIALSLLTVAASVACVGLARSAALQRLASRLVAKVPPLERRRQTLRTAAAALEPLRSARAARHGARLVVRGLGGAAGLDPDGGARRRPRPRLAQRRDGAGRHHVRPGDPVLRRQYRGVRSRRSPSALHLRGRVGRRARVRAHLPRRLGAAPAAARRGRRRAPGHTLPAGLASCAVPRPCRSRRSRCRW